MAQQTEATTDEPDFQETQRVAGLIEQEVAGVTTDTSRHTIKVSFDSHLPPEVGKIARDNGYGLYAVFGATADFSAKDSPRMQRLD